MRWQGRRESDNVEDQRGQSGSPFGGGGGGGFRLPSGKGGIVLLDYCAGGGLLRRGFDRHVDRRTDAAAADLHAALHQSERR